MNPPFPPTRSPLIPQEIFHRIHQTSEGRKTPVVLLHGLLGFSANWGKIWPSLSQDRPVLVLDQCGHGRTAWRDHGYTPGDYAQDLRGLLDHVGWPKVHVVGHSMGGRVALAFCCQASERAQSLVLEDSGMEANPTRVQWIKRLLGSIPTPFTNRETAKQFFAAHYPAGSMLGNFLFANLTEKPDATYDWRFFAPGMRETIETGRALDAMDSFKKVPQPVLVIRGEKSDEFPADEAKRMAAAKPNLELVIIPEAGHFVHAEKPEPFTAALRDFLNRSD